MNRFWIELRFWGLIALGVGGIVWFIVFLTNSFNARQQREIEISERRLAECKDRTNDTEWCFRATFKDYIPYH